MFGFGTDATIERAREVHRRTGATFHAATRVLPREVREATYVLYAFFRDADEIVDGAQTATSREQVAELDRLREAATGRQPASDPLLEAVDELRREHGIPESDVDAFVDAMQADVDPDGYATYEELRSYMEGSAAAVGRMMARVMGADPIDAALEPASTLGVAFQMTNFVRDVREDYHDLGRVYLPEATLDRFGVVEADLDSDEASAGLRAAVRHELARTEELYLRGVDGIELLPEGCRFPVTLAAVLYHDHHRVIAEQGFDVLASRPSLTRRRKWWLAAKARAVWVVDADPASVFERLTRDHSGDRSHPSPEPVVRA
jgi:phytoene synthase